MRVMAKSAFMINGKIHKKGDVVSIETAAYNPFIMCELPEVKVEKKTADDPEPVAEKKAKRTTKKRG